MGKKSAQQADTNLKAAASGAQEQFGISRDLLKEGAPLRKYAENTYMGIAQGNQPGIEKFTAPITQQIDRQFSQAEAAAQQMPPGGLRDQALRDIALQKAQAKNQAYTGSYQEGLSRVASMGFGGTQMGMGGLQAGTTDLAAIAKQYADISGAKGSMAGQGAGAGGAIAGAAIMA